MKCDFDYCIYNKGFACLLNEVEINSLGQCEECIVISLPANKLAKYKKEQLQEIMSRYKDIE